MDARRTTPTAMYRAAYARLYGRGITRPETASRFRRELLPASATYYAEALGIDTGGRSGWISVRCPLHDDHAPSLSVNLDTGGYICHACGAKGGDVLDFHRARYSMPFRQAVEDLGAWR